MKTLGAVAFALLLGGCRPPARPVTYTSTAIYSVTCAAVAGAGLLGTKPSKMIIDVDAELTATQGGQTGRSVTAVAGKAEGAASQTARIQLEIDPTTVNCTEGAKQPAPRLWLNSQTGELSTSPP